jgi:deoxycytidine triphosphate deaminase
MGILNKDEIIRRLEKGELLVNVHKNKNGQYDVEPDSYDLTAGVVIFKEEIKPKQYNIKTEIYNNDSVATQPTITVQPGQMIFVITKEEINLPLEICGTVYSRNSIALEGILALNAGHVDPGYKGPIVIRLINFKVTPWTLKLGDSIFTITFQTVDHKEGDKLVSGPTYPLDKMIDRVHKTADNSLSNALFDLYADRIDTRLNDHYTTVQQNLREDLTKIFLPRNDIMSCLFKHAWAWIVTGVVVVSTILAALFAILQYFK